VSHAQTIGPLKKAVLTQFFFRPKIVQKKCVFYWRIAFAAMRQETFGDDVCDCGSIVGAL
jgi:hypothetical protein